MKNRNKQEGMALGVNKRTGKMGRGMTLVEITLVLMILLSLVGVLFVGAGAYRRGANRTVCIMNLRQIQQACRSMMALNPKATVTGFPIGEFMASSPKCPSSGMDYEVEAKPSDPQGTVFAKCPSGEADHVPTDTASGSW